MLSLRRVAGLMWIAELACPLMHAHAERLMTIEARGLDLHKLLTLAIAHMGI